MQKNYSNDEIVLLLTATVHSQWSHYNNVQKPEVRLNQYVTAIKWYLENTPFRIIVGENSGYDKLKEHIDKKYWDRLELICFVETNTTRNAGYNEMLILHKVKDNSKFIKEASLIFKITGRLIVRNILSHVRQLRFKKGEYYAAHLFRSLVYIDSRFFAFTPSKFDEILELEDVCCALDWKEIHKGTYKNGDGGKYVDFESTIGAAIRNSLYKDKHSFYYLINPFIVSGIEGYYGTKYDDSLQFRIIETIKSWIWYLDYHILVKPSIKHRK